MELKLLQGAIVLVIGPSNSGKTTLLQKLVERGDILPSEVISSDAFRKLVGDTDFFDLANVSKADEQLLYEQYERLSTETFHALHTVVEARAKLNKISFIDATNLRAFERAKYFDIAKRHDVPVIALVMQATKEQLLSRDAGRDNPRGQKRVLKQLSTFKYEQKAIKKEPFASIYTVIDDVHIVRTKPNNILAADTGLDIIGDVHGCFDELIELITKLGYVESDGLYVHPEGRRLVSVGDVMSRGPKSIDTLQFWHQQMEAGLSYMIDSNHGWKIARWLGGKAVTLTHGDENVEQEFLAYAQVYGDEAANDLKKRFERMLLRVPSHYVLTIHDVPRAVVTHAGIKDEFIGKQSPRIADFCRYGDVQDGVRADWFMQHKTSELIIWGHDVHVQPFKANRTINIDQGAVFGGQLTALRYPEEQLVSVNAAHNYAGDENNPIIEARQKHFNAPSATHFMNGFTVHTADEEQITIGPQQAMAAMDTFSHYTMPLEQVLYIPPTMSPTPQTSALPDYLEHPTEAFSYYKKNGVTKMIAEKKHMGSRAVIFIAKDVETAKQLINSDSLGYIMTRTGRAFFAPDEQQQLLARLHAELIAKNYFETHDTSFVLMDAEILPWNLKAQSLIDKQYAAVAEHARMDRDALVKKLAATTQVDVSHWLSQYEEKRQNAEKFEAAFNNYCWPTNDLNDIQIAPFHILAHSDAVHTNKPHSWHMDMATALADNSSLFIATEYRIIENEQDEIDVTKWWCDMTENGHEGIVIKPLAFTAYSKGKLLQPAIKVRGREYLRIIYGMDYTDEALLTRLKERNASRKMRNALLEFKLGIEGISRFVRGESSARVHECALATLALESDVIDPRL